MKHHQNINMYCTDRRTTHIHMKIIYQICINLKIDPTYLPVDYRYQNKIEIPYTCRKFILRKKDLFKKKISKTKLNKRKITIMYINTGG